MKAASYMLRKYIDNMMSIDVSHILHIIELIYVP